MQTTRSTLLAACGLSKITHSPAITAQIAVRECLSCEHHLISHAEANFMCIGACNGDNTDSSPTARHQSQPKRMQASSTCPFYIQRNCRQSTVHDCHCSNRMHLPVAASPRPRKQFTRKRTRTTDEVKRKDRNAPTPNCQDACPEKNPKRQIKRNRICVCYIISLIP